MGRLAVVIALPLIFIAAAVWWLESRFDAGVAITVIGAILGVGALVIGYVLAMSSNKAALNAAASLQESSARVQAAQAGAVREAVRWGGKLDVMNERRVLGLADQRARLLTVGQAPAVDEWDSPGAYAVPAEWSGAQDRAGAERGRPSGRVVYVE